MSKIYLLKCQKTHIPLLYQFVLPFEHTCTELVSFLKKGFDDFYIFSDTQNLTFSKNIQGFFYINKVFLLCLPNFQNEIFQYNELFENFFSSQITKNISLISGEKNSVDFVQNILEHQKIIAKHQNLYKIMTLTKPPALPPEKLSDDDQIKCCTYDDLSALLQLQKSYLVAEVALPNQKISDSETSLMLSSLLKNQLVMAITNGDCDEYVSKINTNAISPHFVQLGGIYTHPLYRKNYYAWHLLYAICKRIQKNNKNVSLFVKNNNEAAINLYKKVGFCIQNDFKIIYF